MLRTAGNRPGAMSDYFNVVYNKHKDRYKRSTDLNSPGTLFVADVIVANTPKNQRRA